MLARFIRSTLLLACVVSAPAMAQDDLDYGRSGYYVGGGLAVGFEAFDDLPNTDVGQAVGIDAHGGYRVTDFWGAEIDMQFHNAYDVVSRSTDKKVGEVRTLDISANLMIYPLSGRIQPYFKVGVGAGWVQSKVPGPGARDSWGTIIRGGGGLDYYLTENIVLNAEAMVARPFEDISGFDHIGVVFGGRYRF